MPKLTLLAPADDSETNDSVITLSANLEEAEVGWTQEKFRNSQ